MPLPRHRVTADRYFSPEQKWIPTKALPFQGKNQRLIPRRNASISDSFSVTSESSFIMPKIAPRLELATFLRQIGYIDALKLEQNRLRQQLQIAMLMFNRQRRSSPARRIAKSGSRPLRLRPRRGRLQFYFALMRYQQNVIASRKRFMFIYTLLTERYIEKRSPLPKTFSWLTELLPNSPDHIFESHTRMSRRSFGMLLQVLESKAGRFFEKKKRGRNQLPLSVQVHLAIYTLGFYGNGANYKSARAKFGYGVGTIINVRRRVINALASLTSEYITWPSQVERNSLCARVRERYGYHAAFFAVDGTTHPFAFVPSYQQNVWYDRKSRYSMQALVTNDIDLRVRHLVVGWPGSTHDARVLASADYMHEENQELYFDGRQHGLGDAAFGLHKRVVPNYKEPLASIPENTEYNRLHSSFRIKSEHTIGNVKNRFQGLKEVRLKMWNEKDVLEVVKYITAGYVLHNMLLDFQDSYHPVTNRHDRVEQEINPEHDEVDIEDEDVGSTAAQIREKVKEQVLTFAGYY